MVHSTDDFCGKNENHVSILRHPYSGKESIWSCYHQAQRSSWELTFSCPRRDNMPVLRFKGRVIVSQQGAYMNMAFGVF
ncbi:hypothetical protein JOB18_000444 [Solea senegalensis]|uniref:Uncharacterized protein n=1 Tax=Solea senegalensis TaxID=28829 RepID=A0AAV6R5V8_SOLSE|nr:hypothetical protein JOB18_000444 [Solea senegalensis]